MSGHPTTPLAFEAIAPDESRARLEAFAKRLRKRRTVRDFAPDPVPHPRQTVPRAHRSRKETVERAAFPAVRAGRLSSIAPVFRSPPKGASTWRPRTSTASS